jgi:arylsulfatase A-like enzyme
MSNFTRKNFLKTLGTSIAAPAILPKLNSEQSISSDAPNVLLMLTDDSSPLSYRAYGNEESQTPHLDQFAKEGMRFDRGYCTSPQCSPARASVLTGRVPHDVEGSRLHQAVPARMTNLIKVLNKYGYHTGAFGKTHQSNIQKDFKYYADYDRFTDTNGGTFNKFFDKRPDGKPFFLWFGSWNPHRPYHPQKRMNKYHHKVDPDKVEVPYFLPDTPKVRQDLAYYYEELYMFDKNCGKLLSILDNRNLAENTIVIQTSDHGMPFPRAKATLYEPGIRIPFVVRWPDVVSAGTASDALVSSMDIGATVLEAAGIPKPGVMQSRSFLPVLTGEKDHVRDYIYAERDWHDNWDPMRCIVGRRYKLIQRYRPEFPFTPALDIQDSLSSKSILKMEKQGKLTGHMKWYKYYQKQRPEMAFYDLKNDPHEWNNLTDGPHRKKHEKERVYEYQVRLSRWMSHTNDFLPPPRTAFPGGPGSHYNRKVDPLNAERYRS